jgi:hypothetical protein
MAEVTKEAKAFFSDINSNISGWSSFFARLSFGEEMREMDMPHLKIIEAISAGMAAKGMRKEDLEAYFGHMFKGFIHSVLADIDGAGSSADNGRQFRLVDNNGNDISPVLHESFVFENQNNS